VVLDIFQKSSKTVVCVLCVTILLYIKTITTTICFLDLSLNLGLEKANIDNKPILKVLKNIKMFLVLTKKVLGFGLGSDKKS